MNWTLHCGDARTVLAELPAESVNCVVTSPPYWGLRDYGHADQIGLESSPDEFVASIVAVFAALRGMLRDDGVCWLNLGDSYANDGKWSGSSGGKHVSELHGNTSIGRRRRDSGLKPKDLTGVPWRAAFALQNDGWYLRSDVIWAKPNPMPESVTDRPTKAHEYVFLLTKSERYAYNADAIAEQASDAMRVQCEDGYSGLGIKDYDGAGVQNPSSVKARIIANARKRGAVAQHKQAELGRNRTTGYLGTNEFFLTRNARSVWNIPTEASEYQHFAVMPKALARKCILAGSQFGGVVLDPFAGVATTGVVALEEGRSFVGVELNEKYHAIGRERLANVAPLLATEIPA